MLVFPFKNASMFCEIDDLYNDYTEDDTSMLYIFDTNLKNSFDEMSEGKEKRLVGQINGIIQENIQGNS